MASVTEEQRGEAELAAALLAVAERRDRDAFALVFAFYAPRAKAWFRGLGADEAAAEELAQEAMLAVWRGAAGFDRRHADASTWVFTLVRGTAARALRREPQPDFDAEDPALVAEPYNASSENGPAVLPPTGSAVRAVVERLPDDEVKLLRMFYQGQEAGTGSARLRGALARLRDALAGRGG
jgi:DNA-directed RNA polymerase specialized sigma24 family protein